MWSEIVMGVLLKDGRHIWTDIHRYLKTGEKEQMKCINCHFADLYAVGRVIMVPLNKQLV